MKSFLSFFAFLSLLLIDVTNIAAARKDTGEYWRAIMKDQPMPEALEELVRIESVSAASGEKTKCNTHATIELKEEEIISMEDLERPIKPKGHVKKSTFADDFEPRPSVTAYVGNEKTSSFELKEEEIIIEDLERPIKPKGHEKKSAFADDFEPRPSVTAYVGNEKTSSFAEDFEPRPNISAYGDDANLKGEKSTSFPDDFEPRPNISAYGGGDGAGHIKKGISFTSDFEAEPSTTSYHN